MMMSEVAQIRKYRSRAIAQGSTGGRCRDFRKARADSPAACRRLRYSAHACVPVAAHGARARPGHPPEHDHPGFGARDRLDDHPAAGGPDHHHDRDIDRSDLVRWHGIGALLGDPRPGRHPCGAPDGPARPGPRHRGWLRGRGARRRRPLRGGLDAIPGALPGCHGRPRYRPRRCQPVTGRGRGYGAARTTRHGPRSRPAGGGCRRRPRADPLRAAAEWCVGRCLDPLDAMDPGRPHRRGGRSRGALDPARSADHRPSDGAGGGGLTGPGRRYAVAGDDRSGSSSGSLAWARRSAPSWSRRA
jgi:hypothetical protein